MTSYLRKWIGCVVISVTMASSFALAWNNDQFIDQSFWDTNPSDAGIIDALLGDGLV
jgi:hypothetical protein